MVMALSMLLSMVLISGLTASAATVYLDGTTSFLPGSVANGFTIIPDATGHGFTIDEQAVAPTGYAGYLNAVNTNGLQYLVLVVDSASGAYWSIEGMTPHYDVNAVGTGTYVLDVGGAGFQGILYFTYGGGNGLIHVKEMYFSDVNPNTAPQNISMTAFVPGFNNTTVSASGADGLGATLAAPWTDTSPNGYTYWAITAAQITATPYLVVDLPDNYASLIAGRCDISAVTWVGVEALSLRRADKQVIDLRTILTGAAVYLNFTFFDTLNFDALYLTNIPQDDTLHVDQAKIGNLGGSVYTNTETGITISGGNYAYFQIEESLIASYPYLYYKLDKVSTVAPGMWVVGNEWAANGLYQVVPYQTTEMQCIDLRTLTGIYGDGNGVVYLSFYPAEDTEIEMLMLSNHNTYSYVQHTVNFVTNGGSAVDAQEVGDGETLSAVSTTNPGYAFGGWYTDAALTQTFDFATAITANTTLYAKWTLAGDISPVFGQLQTGTTPESASAAIRFAAVLDSRQFAEAGFVFSKVTANPTVDDAASLAVSTTTVWTSINAAGSVVTAEELHGSYIFACTVNGIGNANFGTDIYVRAYVKDFDGNYTYTDAKTYSVTNMLG